MRVILILWAIPIVLFWGWYGLSAHNIHFGLHFLERDFHDLLFAIYSKMLGMPAEEIPPLIAWVFFVDTLIVLAVAALRWHKYWLPQTISWIREKIGLKHEEKITEDDRREPFLVQGTPSHEPLQARPVHPAE